MSTLTAAETPYFETLFGMDSGYVINSKVFSDAKFEKFFQQHSVDIGAHKY